MNKIQNLIEPLNLIYYEYDAKNNILILDKNWTKKDMFKELVKITYALSSKKIIFFIDENKSIVISHKDSIIKRINRFFTSIIINIRNKRMNIYILSDKKVKWAKNLPMIKIETIKQDVDFSSYDALIFTSKNAIYSLDEMDETWKKKPAYVVAPQTAKVLKHLGGNLKFVGKEKYGNAFAQELIKKFKNQKLMYVRGSKIVSDLINILNTNGIVCDELIVYKTRGIKYDKKINLPKNSKIIFSSPSTIEHFLKNVIWNETYTAIAIGNTSAKYFPHNIIPIIADTTSLDSCVKKAIEIN